MTNSNERITCPKCRSNNFPGTANCWQCGASLPPPEVIVQAQQPAAPTQPAWLPQAPAAPMPPAATYSYGQAPRRGVRAWMIVVPVVLVLAVAIGVAVAKQVGAKRSGPDDDLKAKIEQLKKQLVQTPTNTDSTTGTDSPDVAAAKSEIDRLRKQYNITPPTDGTGDVHMEHGGKISREQYQQALDALSRSKVGH